MRAPAATKWIYDFAEGSREMRELLGGKGVEHRRDDARARAPSWSRPASRSPPRRASPTCAAAGTPPDGLGEAVDEALARLEAHAGRRLGDPARPAAGLRAQRRARLDARA